MTKETAGEKRSSKQRELESENLDIDQLSKRNSYRFNLPRKMMQAVTGESDYGTELSPAAEKARMTATRQKFPDYPLSSKGYTNRDEDVLRAGREAAAEERREARGMKKGGKVSASSRADGCITKGHTKGRML